MSHPKQAQRAPVSRAVDPIPSTELEKEAAAREVDMADALAKGGADAHLPASESGMIEDSECDRRGSAGIPLLPPD